MEFAGWVVVAIAVMFLGYLIPTAIRSRQVVMDSRVDDRFSVDLRVLARAGQHSAPPTTDSRGYVHRPRTEEETTMGSPVSERQAAAEVRRSATARAARAAASSRRAAAAKRRLVLTVVLSVAAAGGWAFVGANSMNVAWGLIPTLTFLGVLVLGQRAAVAARVADARWEAEIARARQASQARPARAPQRVSAAREDKPTLRIDVDASAAESAAVDVPKIPEGEGWTPIPVPAPMYTMKDPAPRREVTPVAAEEMAPLAQEIAADVAKVAETARAASEHEERPTANGTRPGSVAAPSVDLQAVLERRRAVGQ